MGTAECGRADHQGGGARRFADGRLSSFAAARPSRCSSSRRSRPRASPSRSPTPACPATPAPAGLARLDWSVPDGTDAVILELGANDMLRGVDPKVTRDALARDRPPPEGSSYRGAVVRDAGGAEFGRGLWSRVRCDLSGACRGERSPALPVLSGWRRGRSEAQHRRRPASDRRRRGEDRLRHLAEGRGTVGARPGEAREPE